MTCYLFKQAKVPVILIELGFLSNAQDRSLLLNDTYQDQLILAIITGLKGLTGSVF